MMQPTPPSPHPQTVNAHISNMLSIIKAHALVCTRPDLFNKQLNLAELRNDAQSKAAQLHGENPSMSASDLVREVATFIAKEVHSVDGHTSFSRKTPSSDPNQPIHVSIIREPPLPTATVHHDGVAVLELPECDPKDPDEANKYATTGQQAMQRCLNGDTQIRAWVIDLRSNPGGNMWPMMEVIAPLLGTDTPGGFDDPLQQGQKIPWNISAQQWAQIPVAVWTGKYTFSSGEIISIMFRGRPETRFFGSSTGGAPTANYSFAIEDIGTLHLTTALCFDRNEKSYFGPIPPDEEISVPVPSKEAPWDSTEFKALLADNAETLLRATRAWLNQS